MLTLKFMDESFDCATAIKGDNYIHLLNGDGKMIAAFDNITDFSEFTLENGAYTEPAADHDCYVAVVRDDGTLGKGGHKCSKIASKSTKTTATISSTGWSGSSAPYTKTLSISGVKATSVVEVFLPSTASTDQVAAFQKLNLQDGGQSAGSITLRAFGTKNEIDIPVNIIIRGDL